VCCAQSNSPAASVWHQSLRPAVVLGKRRHRRCEVLELDLSGFPTYQELAHR
jgi:hypothetical protein